jgi:tetratricopeptide (TPR) repeat protein
VLYLHGEFNHALAELHLAVDLDPRNAEFRAGLGSVLRNAGRRDDAVAKFRQAIALESDQAAYHALFGSLLSDMGQGDAAAAEFQRALGLDPELPGELTDAARMFTGLAAGSASSDFANATLTDACWLVVTSERLAPDDADSRATMQRIDQQMQEQQHCPPR